MTKPIESMPGRPSLEKLWLQQQFEQLHREHTLILSKLEGGNISHDLQKAIMTTAVLCKTLDLKVPDAPPPISNPKP